MISSAVLCWSYIRNELCRHPDQARTRVALCPRPVPFGAVPLGSMRQVEIGMVHQTPCFCLTEEMCSLPCRLARSKGRRKEADPTLFAAAILPYSNQSHSIFKIVQCLDNKSRGRPLGVSRLIQLGLDHAGAIENENDRPWHAVGLAAGLVLWIAQSKAIDDL